jgi:hypothetical protein
MHKITNPIDPSLPNATSTNKNDAEWDFIFDLYKKHPQAFHLRQDRQSCPPQTLKEFKDEFVIDIYEQLTTNQHVRQAVRSHSPLLSVRNPNNAYLSNRSAVNSSIANLSQTATSIGSASPKITRSASPSPSSRNSLDHNDLRIKNNATNANTNANRPYPYQHQLHISKPFRVSLINSANKPQKNDSITVNSLNINDDNVILFDKILDKIVDTLITEPVS